MDVVTVTQPNEPARFIRSLTGVCGTTGDGLLWGFDIAHH